MSNECKYVPKNIVKEYRQDMETAILKVKKDIEKIYKKDFESRLVGSSKMSLVVQRGNSHWDVDYQFFFHDELFNDTDPPKLKEDVKESLKKHLGEKYSVNLSTSVISAFLIDEKGKHAMKSFDIALIKTNPGTKNKEILKGTSLDKNDNDNFIKWIELSGSGIYKKRREIKGKAMKDKLSKIFLSKKCNEMSLIEEERKPTFSLYIEAIKETLDYFKEVKN